MRFGSAEAMPSEARSVSSAACRDAPAGSATRLNPPSPVAVTTAPTRPRAWVQTLGSTNGLQLTIICCGAMTCGSPSMTWVTFDVARAGPASASTAARERGMDRWMPVMHGGRSNSTANLYIY